jgi:hypothetical protein
MLYATPVPHQRISGTVPVRADIYPANVVFSFADRTYEKARAILTADKAIILVEGGGHGAAVLYEGRLEDVEIVARKELIATTAEGRITISRGGGCGCGSRLRGYRPFGRAVHLAQVPA